MVAIAWCLPRLHLLFLFTLCFLSRENTINYDHILIEKIGSRDILHGTPEH